MWRFLTIIILLLIETALCVICFALLGLQPTSPQVPVLVTFMVLSWVMGILMGLVLTGEK